MLADKKVKHGQSAGRRRQGQGHRQEAKGLAGARPHLQHTCPWPQHPLLRCACPEQEKKAAPVKMTQDDMDADLDSYIKGRAADSEEAPADAAAPATE